MILKKHRRHLSSFQLIILGFLGVILVGSILLTLPFSSVEPGCAPFLDALFTATSAVCVTGLVVHDTATYWTQFGQFIILVLIQIGGMGVVTMAASMSMVVGRKIGLFQRNTMQEAIAAHSVGGIVRLTSMILRISLIVEGIGAVVMAPVFCSELGFFKGIWYAVFHSISAFCNAGFDLMGIYSPCSSLMKFHGNVVINLMIIILILVGGLGFLTWEDIGKHKFHFSRYRMQSKLIFAVTGILVFFPMLYFYFIELGLPRWQSLTGLERFLGAFFQAVTPRTAGFNTLDLSAFTETGQMLIIILMLIGGSPGSTAGGMKTTTAAVLILSLYAVFRREEDAHCFGRRIADSTIKTAATIFVMYTGLFLFGGMIISSLEGLPMMTCLFETASAIATVGLSLGITSELGTISRILLIILMYLGRVGGLTLVYATIERQKITAKLPQEKIMVG